MSIKITETTFLETPNNADPNVLVEDNGSLVRIPASKLSGAKVDATLTQAGQAADAAAVGERLSALSEEISNLGGGLLTVETITVGDESETIPVTGLSLDLSSYSATVGDSFYINPVVAPSNATNKAVSWNSSNTSVATVDSSGYVECIADGDAVIICITADGGYTATCAVSVAAAESGGTIGEKVQFSTLEKSAGMMGPSGTIISLGSTYHVQLPYTDGMVVSTGTNVSWDTTKFPPMVVYDNGDYSLPDFESTDKTSSIESKYATQFLATITGYSESAVVYATFLVGGTITDSAILQAMDDADMFYYIPGGDE